MFKRMAIALAGLLALFGLAAAPASAAPAAASSDNTIMAVNQWVAFTGESYSGTITVTAHSATCAATPQDDTNSATNGSDSGRTLQLFSSPNCASGTMVAQLSQGTAATWATSALSFRSI